MKSAAQTQEARGNRANALSENHLWLRYRKVSDLSGLIQPKILPRAFTPGGMSTINIIPILKALRYSSNLKNFRSLILGA